MTSNLFLELRKLKQNEAIIIADNISKEEKQLLKEVLERCSKR